MSLFLIRGIRGIPWIAGSIGSPGSVNPLDRWTVGSMDRWIPWIPGWDPRDVSIFVLCNYSVRDLTQSCIICQN